MQPGIAGEDLPFYIPHDLVPLSQFLHRVLAVLDRLRMQALDDLHLILPRTSETSHLGTTLHALIYTTLMLCVT